MHAPPPLKPGDSIGIVAPARKVSRDELKPALEWLRSLNFKVVEGKYLYEAQNQFSGTDLQRLGDLQTVLDDPAIRAVLFARGGYGALRIIDRLSFSGFMSHPKWLIGFSDMTVFHSHVHSNCKVQTLHAPMALNIAKTPPEILNAIANILTGGNHAITVPGNPLNRYGKTSATLTGGNLSLLYALNNSASDINTNGKILFIEDLDEYLYHIDRMMLSLKRSGKLRNLAGLIVGAMSEMKDNAIPFGKTAEEIIREAVDEYDFPVCFNFPSGHIESNHPLVLGREAILEVDSQVTFSYRNI